MNEPNLPPPPPSLTPSATVSSENFLIPLGDHPEDVREIRGVTEVIESVLRHPRRIIYHLHQNRPGKLIFATCGIAFLCCLLYGVVVGSFSGGNQLWAAPLKISLGMIFAAVICLPSLYIFACLGGSQARIVEVVGLLSGLLTLMTLLLIGFAPVAWIFSRSIDSLAGMGALHLLFWLVSVVFGARFLKTGFRHLGIRSDAGINFWLIVFLLVMMQMTTALRPLIGSSDTLLTKEKKFFLAYWFDNMEPATKATR